MLMSYLMFYGQKREFHWKIPFYFGNSCICFALFIKIISLRKKCGLFSYVFKKIIPNNTAPTFQEVGGET